MAWRSIGDLGRADGLATRGAFHPTPADAVPAFADGAPIGTLVLLGFAGGVGWPVFAASAEAMDGAPHPLDRWSRRVVGALADACGGVAHFPFGGPPWLPFQRWAQRAEPVFQSPLGLLIHPQWGLWHSYRGALALRERLELAAVETSPHPCDACAARPCLSACPVGAFAAPENAGVIYDVARCAGHVATPRGADCFAEGCKARRACPVGAGWAYGRAQTAFHMSGFMATRR